MDYTELIADHDTDGSIRNWCNDSRVPATTILTEAEAWIYTKLRVRKMLFTHTTTSLAAGSDTIPLPSDYVAAYFFRFTGTVQSRPARRLLDYVLSQFTYDGNGNQTTGIPQYYATDESNIQFEVSTSQALNFLFKYYRRLPALSDSNKNNFLTDDFPYLLRATCLWRAYEHLKNTREKQYWLAIAQAQIDEAHKDSDLEMAGMELQMQVDYDGMGGF